MILSGYKRLTPHENPQAVAWWFVKEFDDGFCFARGGRVRTTREARHIIDGVWRLAEADHRVYLERPQFILRGEDMEPVNYGYGA